MAYESSLQFTPDKYSHAFVYNLDATGEIVLTSNSLYIPSRTTYITIDTLPLIGVIKLNGVPIVAESSGGTPTQIQRTDIDNGLLLWDSGLSETSERLQFDFFAFDAADEIQSLFYDWLPANAILEPSEIVDGGNFNTNVSLGGVSADAGDFNTGANSTLLQSYSGGDFDTGEAVRPIAPTVEFPAEETDALNVIDPDTLQTVDVEQLQTVHETYSSEPLFFRLDLATNFTYEVYYKVKERQFAGWDYGSIVPDFGYNIDYGTIAEPGTESYDYNSITSYVKPYPASTVI